MMRKMFTTVLLLGTIVLFSAAAGNANLSGVPDPGCLPCGTQ